MIQLSGKTLLIGAQSILNLFLTSWLVNEYLHNRFMRDYLANTFSSMSLAIPVGLVASAAIAGSSLTVYSRRHRNVVEGTSGLNQVTAKGQEEKLVVLDACPFCNVPLKKISDNRLQCRKCRRYFKK